MSSMIQIQNSLAAQSRENGAKIDVEFVNPFLEATKTTLESQAKTKVKMGKPYLKTDAHPAGEIDIAGVISLTSEAFQGSIALCFPAKVFLAIYSNMVGENHSEITSDIEDAAGELLNIIFGQAKTALNEKSNLKIRAAIPTVIRGHQLHVRHLAKRVAIILPCETEQGNFQVEISADAI